MVLLPGTGTDAVLEARGKTLAQKMNHSCRNTKGRADVLGAAPQHQHSDSSTQVLGAAAASGLDWERLQLGQVLPFYEGVQALSTHRAEAPEKAVTPVHRWPVKHRKSRT